MARALQIRNLLLGAGIPKVCAPLTDPSVEGLLSSVEKAKTLNVDLIEWRVDYFENPKDCKEVCSTLRSLRAALGETPLLFTFRRKIEGGELEVEDTYYCELLEAVARTGFADLIDIEFSVGEVAFSSLQSLCEKEGVVVVCSYHNFENTPNEAAIIDKLKTMEAAGAHIPKVAVMPRTSTDVLTLLSASNIFAQQTNQPFIAISMGSFGTITRLSGEIFGSAITFASLESTSAPGQLAVSEVQRILALLHQNR